MRGIVSNRRSPGVRECLREVLWSRRGMTASWSLVLRAFAESLSGQSVRGFACDGDKVLAIVGGHSLYRRDVGGEWSTLATSDLDLSCCTVCDGIVYVGSDDARMLRLSQRGRLEPLEGFSRTPGREKWYAGTAVIDGHVVGPPLGVRSMTASCDGSALLANVHVGGIPRSVDGGATWQPTLDVESDVHEVVAHPARANVAIAASAVGLQLSNDGGASWTSERDGLHAPYCPAVAFLGDNILVFSSTDHFAAQAAIYTRALDKGGPLQPIGGGLPRWIEGIADTGCIATRGDAAAVIDRGGNLYLSSDAGKTWSRKAERIPRPSGVLVL